MPSTPETPTSRDVTVASNECRLNALKIRKENDWFGHDVESKTTSGQRLTSASGGGARTPSKTSLESEQWFRFDAKGIKPETQVTSRSKANAIGDQQDWYKHGPDVPDPPSWENKPKTRSRRSACSEVRQRATDSNDWFRHDHKNGPTTSGSRKPFTGTSPTTALWVVTSEDGKSPTDLASTPRPKSRLTGPEADEYYRRNKTGTSSEWFSHEHPGDDTSGGSGNVRTRGTPEGGEIANRLKGESDEWFSHDANRAYITPTPVVRGNSPLTRELKERSQGREIKQLFRIEENLRTTWVAPPSLLGSPETPTAPSTGTPFPATVSNGNSDVIQESRDNLSISNGQDAASNEQHS